MCFDLPFADVFWDAAEATDCYVVLANWPASRREHWQALLVTDVDPDRVAEVRRSLPFLADRRNRVNRDAS